MVSVAAATASAWPSVLQGAPATVQLFAVSEPVVATNRVMGAADAGVAPSVEIPRNTNETLAMVPTNRPVRALTLPPRAANRRPPTFTAFANNDPYRGRVVPQ